MIAGIGTVGYASHGDLSWPLAALISTPVLLGALVGWHLARTLPGDHLGIALTAALFLVGTYLLVRGLSTASFSPDPLCAREGAESVSVDLRPRESRSSTNAPPGSRRRFGSRFRSEPLRAQEGVESRGI